MYHLYNPDIWSVYRISKGLKWKIRRVLGPCLVVQYYRTNVPVMPDEIIVRIANQEHIDIWRRKCVTIKINNQTRLSVLISPYSVFPTYIDIPCFFCPCLGFNIAIGGRNSMFGLGLSMFALRYTHAIKDRMRSTINGVKHGQNCHPSRACASGGKVGHLESRLRQGRWRHRYADQAPPHSS